MRPNRHQLPNSRLLSGCRVTTDRLRDSKEAREKSYAGAATLCETDREASVYVAVAYSGAPYQSALGTFSGQPACGISWYPPLYSVQGARRHD